MRDSVSTLRRGEDGKYPERASRNQEQSKFVDIYVPPHLYGQLVQHKDGLDAVLEYGDIDALIEIVNKKKCATAEETRDLKAALWALAHFGTSVETVSILEDSGVLESMTKLGRTCAVLSVRHTIFHCLCLICVTQPGAEGLRKYEWYCMPRSHHESFPLWSLHNVVEKNTAAMLRQLDLDFPNETDTGFGMNEPDKMSLASNKTDSDSNMLLEEEEDMQFLMVEEEGDQVDGTGNSRFARELEEGSTSEATQQALGEISTRKISYDHHRSKSDSQALGITLFKASTSPPKTSRGNGSGGGNNTALDVPSTSSKQRTISSSSSAAYGSFRGRVSSFFAKSSGVGSAPSTSGSFYARSNSGSFKWRTGRSRSDSASESVTSGVSSGDSTNTVPYQSTLLHGGRVLTTSSYVSEHIPTLSPIPSSASIATVCSNPQSQNDQTNQLSPQSKDGSRLTLTEPVGRYSFTSPAHRSMYRSVKLRKPKIRMPILSDPDLYPMHPYTVRMSGSYEPRTASLDRHFVLSAGDLFSESKLIRVNSSMTSLSTPSFRLRPEAETKGPCLMGLALPNEFDAIFMVESVKPFGRHGIIGAGPDDSANLDGGGKLLLDDNESVPSLENMTQAAHSFDFHSVHTCLGCMKLKITDETGEQMDLETISFTNDNPGESGEDNIPTATPSRNKPLEVIAECSETVERGSPREPLMLTPVRPGAAPGVSGQSPYHPNQEIKTTKEAKFSMVGQMDEQTLLRKEVLKHVSNMICGVGSKNNEQNLLRLKQKFPSAFKDICLYTELCAILSRYNVRLPIRRFIQELFLDITFEEVSVNY